MPRKAASVVQSRVSRNRAARGRGRVNPEKDRLVYRGWVIKKRGDKWDVRPPRDISHSLDGGWTADTVAQAKREIDESERGRKNAVRMTKDEKALLGAGKRLALAGVYPVGLLVNKGKRKKKNPSEDAAAEAFREFHGYDADGYDAFETIHHYPDFTSAIGDLEHLVIRVPKERKLRGGQYAHLDDFAGAWLTEHPKMKQLYVEGGDQSIDLEEFGLDSNNPHEVEYLGELVLCEYFTRKDHLGKDGGIATYHHRFGKNELTLKKTELIRVGYHVPDEQILFVGGGYEIPSEGIDG